MVKQYTATIVDEEGNKSPNTPLVLNNFNGKHELAIAKINDLIAPSHVEDLVEVGALTGEAVQKLAESIASGEAPAQPGPGDVVHVPVDGNH